jgi:hypothetical protein
MRTHLLVAALLSTSALVFTACGTDPSTGGGSAADREQKMQDAALEYARCMRENGVDMPDPKFREGGMTMKSPEGVSPSRMRKADQACRKILEAVKPPEMSESEQKEFRAAALANARCMREHGINFPDPTFGPDGGARIKIGRGSGIDPESAKFKAAQKACESTMPKPPGGESGEGPSTHEETP